MWRRASRASAALLTRLPRFRRARRRVERLCARVRAAHDPAHRSGVPRDLVDDLLALHAADPRFLPETDLVPALLGPFVAGLDTLGGTTAFMLYALLTHPELLARMRAEVDAAFDDGPLTAQALGRLDVTHRVALETLRLYPIAPVLTRTVTNAFDFGGYTIPAGERVIVADRPTVLKGDDPYPLTRLNLPPAHRVNVGASLNGRRFLGDLTVHHATAAFWSDVLTSEYHGYSPAYTLVNATAGIKWRDGRWTTLLRVGNLLNTTIRQHIFGDLLRRSVIGELRISLP